MKTVPIKKYKKFLKSLGLKHIRTKSSHEIYNFPKKPLLRPVTVDTNYPDVPIRHIHTSLKTLGISKKEFEEKIKEL
jgi:predicted RNA binding protein YcfA (HicA-like mRNA interferase family)